MTNRQLIYTICPKDYHASYYYRIVVPMTTMEELGLGAIPVIDDAASDVDAWRRITALTHSDLNLMYQPIGRGFLANMKTIQEWKAVKAAVRLSPAAREKAREYMQRKISEIVDGLINSDRGELEALGVQEKFL